MKKRTNHKTVIGIDPDIDKCGVAILCEDSLELYGLGLFDLIEFLKDKEALIILEDINSNTAYYGGSKNQAIARNHMRSVGQSQAIAKLIEQQLIKQGKEFIKVKPLKGFLKKWKHDKEAFQRDTGYSKPSNHDKRDAAALAYYGASIYTNIKLSLL